MQQNMKDVFAERLKAVRENLKWTQAKMADELGITRQAIVNYEKGERLPDVSILARMVQVCGCSANYLLGLQPEIQEKYSGLTEVLPLSESSLSTIAQNAESADVLNALLSYPQFWGLLKSLQYIYHGEALIDSFEQINAKECLRFYDWRIHEQLSWIIERFHEEGERHADQTALIDANEKWREAIMGLLRLASKTDNKMKEVTEHGNHQ